VTTSHYFPTCDFAGLDFRPEAIFQGLLGQNSF